MNFLELCQETARLCEITGGGPNAVATATGENLSVVRWTREAWLSIQREREWTFLREPLSFLTVAGTGEYSLADMGATSMRRLDTYSLRTYLESVGIADEQFITEWDWESWYDTYGYNQQIDGRPSVFAVKPGTRALLLAPVPDAVYRVRGWYWKNAVSLTDDADEPAITSDLHMLIPYRAAMSYANREVASEVKQEAFEQYAPMYSQLCSIYLPPVGPGRPLA